MKEKIPNPYPDNNCFFCGSENSSGLKLTFYWDKDKRETNAEYVPEKRFAGQGKILHGAIQMGLLDEIMGWTSYAYTQEMAVTSGLNVTFLRPTYIFGDTIRVVCRIISRDGSKVHMEATLLNNDGEVCTTGTGTFHILSEHKYNDLIHAENRTPKL